MAKLNVKKVFAFRASDGVAFWSKGRAMNHEREVKRKREIKDWVDAHCAGDEEVANALVEYGHELVGLLMAQPKETIAKPKNDDKKNDRKK